MKDTRIVYIKPTGTRNSDKVLPLEHQDEYFGGVSPK
jgi:hypothetical protein